MDVRKLFIQKKIYASLSRLSSSAKYHQFSTLCVVVACASPAYAAGPLNVDGRTETITSQENYTDLKVGVSKTGTLLIQGNGQVSTDRTFVGHGKGSSGVLSISGSDASLDAKNYLKIGYQGDGEVEIKDGAKVKTVQTNFAEISNTTGTMRVTGKGSLLDSKLSVGVYGHGELTIANGGVVSSDHASFGGVLSNSGSATVLITGKGSLLDVTKPSNILYGAIIGSSGTAELTIEKGGVMSAYNISIGNAAGSSGTVNLLGDSDGIGVLRTKTIAKVAGNALFNFNGGTVQAMANSTLFKGFSASDIQLQANGGRIDSNGFTVTLGVPLTSASGVGALTKVGEGTLYLSGHNSYTGDTRVQNGTLSVSADAFFSPYSVHQTLANGILDLNGTDQTVAGMVNAGRVKTAGGLNQRPFVTLSVNGDYTGSGVLELNSELGDDHSPSDFLHVSGKLDGATRLAINAVAGAGALTTGDGIPVVQVDKAVLGSISLEQERVAAGAYEYTLKKRPKSDGSVGWYLYSGYDEPTPDPDPDPGPNPNPDPDPDPDPDPNPLPNYRVEVPIAVVAPRLASQIGAEMLGSYYERTGAQTRYRSAEHSAIWARAFGVSGKTGERTGSARQRLEKFDQYGSVYSYKIGGVQFGADLYTKHGEEQASTNAGIYTGIAYGTSDVDRIYGGDAGKMTSTAYALGGYWTQHAENGAWVDAVAQFTYQHLRGSSDKYGVSGRSHARGFDLSVETGYPINLNSVVLEPQAQLVYQYLNLGTLRDPYGKASYDDAKGFLGRIGARASTSWLGDAGHTYSAWTDVSLWRNFSNDATLHFSGPNSSKSKSFSTDRKETWVKWSLGLNGQVDKQLSMFGSVNYRQTVGSRSGEALGVMLGMQYQW